MRTEIDLQSAFRALEDVAESYGTPDFRIPTAELTDTTPRNRPSRARVLVSSLAAAAAVIAALAITSVVTHRPGSHGHSVVGTPRPTPTHTTEPTAITAPRAFDLRALWFTLRPMSGVTVTGYKLFANAQQVALDTTDGQHWDVTLSAAGSPQPKSTPGSQPLRIGGRPGYYGELTGLAFATPADQPIGLVWQYAPGAWATAVSADQTAISSDDATKVAAAVIPGRTQPVTVPLSLGTAPPGMRLEGYLGGIGGSRATQHGTEGVNALIDFTTGAGTAFTVDLEPRTAGENYTGTPTTVAGRKAYVVDGSVTILVDSTYVAHVGTMPGGPAVTTAQVLDVAKSISFAGRIQDQGTWFDARVALP